jgi:hypothetical protein
VVEYEIHGVKIMVEAQDLGRLTRFVDDATAALKDRPELLTRLDSVERQAVSVRQMADSVEGEGAVTGLVMRLQQGTR